MKAGNLSSEKILATLKDHSQELRNRFSVKKIGIFGSYVRDDYSDDSDIDLLVEFTDITFDNYMDLKFYLTDIFDHEIDLVLYDSIKPRLKPHIINEVQFVQGL